MKKAILFVCAVFALATLTLSPGSAHAQSKSKKVVDVIGKTAPKSRGANPNIKSDEPKVDKPVAKPRGTTCSVDFDNFTGLYVKVYVDGYYKGTLGPYEDGNVTVGSGYTSIYCISTGGTTEWSAKGNCDGGYVFNLKYSTSD